MICFILKGIEMTGLHIFNLQELACPLFPVFNKHWVWGFFSFFFNSAELHSTFWIFFLEKVNIFQILCSLRSQELVLLPCSCTDATVLSGSTVFLP